MKQSTGKNMLNKNRIKIVSLNSLMNRSELIKKSTEDFIEKSNKLLGVFSDRDLEFARRCKEFLPAHESAIVHLRFWENLNFLEIAQIIKISEKLVKQIFEKAINRLKMIYLNIKFENRDTLKQNPSKYFSKLPAKSKSRGLCFNKVATFQRSSVLNNNLKFG